VSVFAQADDLLVQVHVLIMVGGAGKVNGRSSGAQMERFGANSKEGA
jgi:hypothetical protein